jgi:hypothetical protein
VARINSIADQTSYKKALIDLDRQGLNCYIPLNLHGLAGKKLLPSYKTYTPTHYNNNNNKIKQLIF